MRAARIETRSGSVGIEEANCIGIDEHAIGSTVRPKRSSHSASRGVRINQNPSLAPVKDAVAAFNVTKYALRIRHGRNYVERVSAQCAGDTITNITVAF